VDPVDARAGPSAGRKRSKSPRGGLVTLRAGETRGEEDSTPGSSCSSRLLEQDMAGEILYYPRRVAGSSRRVFFLDEIVGCIP